MKKTIFTLNIIKTFLEDDIELYTYVFDNFAKAKEKSEEVEKEWIALQRSINEDLSDEEFDKWLLDIQTDDLEHDSGLYKEYIYSDGNEMVFAIDKHEVDINSLFVLTKESVFTENQFEVDNSIELITGDFEKGLTAAYKLKEEAIQEMTECIRTESLEGTHYDFLSLDPENGDRILIRLTSVEVAQ